MIGAILPKCEPENQMAYRKFAAQWSSSNNL
jgi:hypothetical protein